MAKRTITIMSNRICEMDPYWTDKGKEVIAKVIDVFDQMIMTADTSGFTMDGSTVHGELSDYVFHITPYDGRVSQFDVQCCPRSPGNHDYLFAVLFHIDKGIPGALVYHNRFGPYPSYGLEMDPARICADPMV